MTRFDFSYDEYQRFLERCPFTDDEKIILENDGNYKETRLQGIIEEKARLAEEARLEAERIENEKRLAEEAEKERLAEEARKEAE